MRRIVPSGSTVAPQDAWIVPGKARPSIVIRIVDGFRKCVSTLDHQTIRKLAVNAGLEGVIVGIQEALPKQGLRRTAVGWSIEPLSSLPGAGQRSVQVHVSKLVNRLGTDVSHGAEKLRRKFPFHYQVP